MYGLVQASKENAHPYSLTLKNSDHAFESTADEMGIVDDTQSLVRHVDSSLYGALPEYLRNQVMVLVVVLVVVVVVLCKLNFIYHTYFLLYLIYHESAVGLAGCVEFYCSITLGQHAGIHRVNTQVRHGMRECASCKIHTYTFAAMFRELLGTSTKAKAVLLALLKTQMIQVITFYIRWVRGYTDTRNTYNDIKPL